MKAFLPILILITILFTACAPAGAEIPTLTPVQVDTPAASSPTPNPNPKNDSMAEGTFLGLTYQRQDGNRFIEGRGAVTQSDPLRIPLSGEIAWLVGVPYREGSLWTAVLDDGSVETILVEGGQAEFLDLGWESLPPGTPPLVTVHEGEARLIRPPTESASQLTHPAVVGLDPLRLLYIEIEGDLVLLENDLEVDRLAVNALPDARILVDGAGRILLLSGPTDRYTHGVLGDSLEASSITLLNIAPGLEILARIEIPAPAVVEGIAPIWADLDGDGSREILATVSDLDQGARLVLYSEEGQILAEGPAAGQGFRWRHQLAAVPLDGGPELAVYDVLRPHLDALLEVFRWNGGFLTVMEQIPGYPSHSLGSRNLDQTLAGDLDGDGLPEVVVPGRDGTTLEGLFYREGAMGGAWRLELDGQLTSNLAGVTLPDGSLTLGAGVGAELVIIAGQ